MNKELETFYKERKQHIEAMPLDKDLKNKANDFMKKTGSYKYTYNFDWFGRPIIQFPQDIVALQELFFKIKPTIYIETGIAHGGSSILASSMMYLLDIYDGISDISQSTRKVISIDIDIKAHNRNLIENHPFSKNITLIEGSSTDQKTIDQVKEIYEKESEPIVMVSLDSNHTSEHVAKELEMYSEFVSHGSYLIVWDTSIEFDDNSLHLKRPWSSGNSPLTAIKQWLPNNPSFIVDHEISDKLLITVAPSGFLRKL
tara:strand:- start:532 stop:1302 length:771 start_codon:yes stop_codon:yes gene_type:complete